MRKKSEYRNRKVAVDSGANVDSGHVGYYENACAIANAAIAAVSARRIEFPSEAAIHLRSLKNSSSGSVHPPSGPTASDNSGL